MRRRSARCWRIVGPAHEFTLTSVECRLANLLGSVLDRTLLPPTLIRPSESVGQRRGAYAIGECRQRSSPGGRTALRHRAVLDTMSPTFVFAFPLLKPTFSHTLTHSLQLNASLRSLPTNTRPVTPMCCGLLPIAPSPCTDIRVTSGTSERSRLV